MKEGLQPILLASPQLEENFEILSELMSTSIHFINVGQSNMSLVEYADRSNFVVDCTITGANQRRVLNCAATQMGRGHRLRAFMCTHRDADHMRGVHVLHVNFPIQGVSDSGYPRASTDTHEYEADMRRREGQWPQQSTKT